MKIKLYEVFLTPARQLLWTSRGSKGSEWYENWLGPEGALEKYQIKAEDHEEGLKEKAWLVWRFIGPATTSDKENEQDEEVQPYVFSPNHLPIPFSQRHLVSHLERKHL